jgi:transcription initiation factor TFIIF subunit beta
LVGRVSTELNCVAADTEEARRLLAERTFKQMTAKKPLTFLRGAAGDISQAGVHAGSVRDAAVFGNFIRNTGTVKGKSKQDTKFARLPQNELFDALFRCFRKYNFWSMKALRSELQQPEAYLRESLEKIADMPRSGRFAMLWTLKPENKVANFDGMDDAAPEGADIPEDDDGEEEDEEDMKLEDVNF